MFRVYGYTPNEGTAGTSIIVTVRFLFESIDTTFLRIVGSELIQKYLGDGPKLVRELFRVAEEHAPSIVFIDEIDAVGTKRYVILAWRIKVRAD